MGLKDWNIWLPHLNIYSVICALVLCVILIIVVKVLFRTTESFDNVSQIRCTHQKAQWQEALQRQQNALQLVNEQLKNVSDERATKQLELVKSSINSQIRTINKQLDNLSC